VPLRVTLFVAVCGCPCCCEQTHEHDLVKASKASYCYIGPTGVQGKKKKRDPDEDDGEEEAVEEERPTQLQICVSIANKGETEFHFQAATIADFAVKDMNEHHDSVRLVGLGNRHALDPTALDMQINC